MCGIVGVLDPRRSDDERGWTSLLEAMARPMEPRGPDGSGSWSDPEAGIGLGHRRLSVIDLSEAGSQPMVSRDGRWVITYNGEIYNHPALAGRLTAEGVGLCGHSDTEVLLETIARHGITEALTRSDGMFALGVWDRQERQLTLARDRVGEKPLYYGRLGHGSVVFGSSLDALRAHPRFDRPVDRDAVALFLRYKYVPSPWSIFSGIHKLPPGCSVTVDSDGSVGSPQAYWDLMELAGDSPRHWDPREAVDELEALLATSVRERLVADVPVGAFLSGGIDSSAVVAAAQAVSRSPVRTFTIGSPDRDFDESDDAARVARHLGTDHTELEVTGEDALDVVDRLGAMYDEPFADSSQIPTFLVSQLARQEVTVALSGDGGDELFAGYNRHVWVPGMWRRLAPLPVRARRGVARTLRRVPPSTWDRAGALIPASRRPRQLGLKVSKVASIADATGAEDVYGRLVTHWPDAGSLVRGGQLPPTIHDDPALWPRSTDLVTSMCAVDAVTYLPDDVLAKVDRAAMAVSLETRVPLLSRDIIEFAFGLPTSLKIRDGSSKWVLRQVLGRHVPPELFERPKAGFGLAVDDWLRGPLREWANDLLFGPEMQDLLDPGPIRRAWDEHQSGRANHAYELWDVAQLAAWCRHRGIDP